MRLAWIPVSNHGNSSSTICQESRRVALNSDIFCAGLFWLAKHLTELALNWFLRWDSLPLMTSSHLNNSRIRAVIHWERKEETRANPISGNTKRTASPKVMTVSLKLTWINCSFLHWFPLQCVVILWRAACQSQPWFTLCGLDVAPS